MAGVGSPPVTPLPRTLAVVEGVAIVFTVLGSVATVVAVYATYDAARNRDPIDLSPSLHEDRCEFEHPGGHDVWSLKVELLDPSDWAFERGRRSAKTGRLKAGETVSVPVTYIGGPTDRIINAPSVRVRVRRAWSVRRDPAQLFHPPFIAVY